MSLAPFLLEEILYLYKLCQIDKVRESYSVLIPKSPEEESRGWTDTRHDLGRVRKWPLQIPSLLPSSGRGQKLSLGGFQIPGVSDVDRGAKWMRTFWTWIQGVHCYFRFCRVVVCIVTQSGMALNERHIRCCADLITAFRAILCSRWVQHILSGVVGKVAVLLWMWVLFEEDMAYLARQFASLLLWHVLDPK